MPVAVIVSQEALTESPRPATQQVSELPAGAAGR